MPESLDPLFAGMLLVFLMLGLYAAGVWFFSENMASRGQFGDMFGGVNSIISGMTLAGLVFTIYLQRIELKLAHDEVAWQEATNIKQQVGSTFFQLLQLQATILTDLTITTQNGTLRGRAAFAHAQNRLKQIHPMYRFGTGPDRWIGAVASYESLDVETGRVLGHYFRNLYHIIKFIDESDVTDDQKKQYTSIARAQISEDETIVLYFVERYALLEHLPKWIFDGEDLKLYTEAAYGTNEDLLLTRTYL